MSKEDLIELFFIEESIVIKGVGEFFEPLWDFRQMKILFVEAKMMLKSI
jgi:hypothetical protein